MMNYINEILLLAVVVALILISIRIQSKVETNRLFKIRVTVGTLLIVWVWIDPSGSIALSALITVSVISGLYTFYKKKVKNA